MRVLRWVDVVGPVVTPCAASGGAASGGTATCSSTCLASGGAACGGSGSAQKVCAGSGGAASGGSGQATCSLQGIASGGAASGGSCTASGGSTPTAATPDNILYSRPQLPAYPVRHRYRHRLELRTYAESHAITLLRHQTQRACKRTQNPIGWANRHQRLPEMMRCEARGRINVRDLLHVESLHRYRHLEWSEMLRMLRIQESQINELIDHL